MQKTGPPSVFPGRIERKREVWGKCQTGPQLKSCLRPARVTKEMRAYGGSGLRQQKTVAAQPKSGREASSSDPGVECGPWACRLDGAGWYFDLGHSPSPQLCAHGCGNNKAHTTTASASADHDADAASSVTNAHHAFSSGIAARNRHAASTPSLALSRCADAARNRLNL